MSADKPQKGKTLNPTSKTKDSKSQGTETAADIPAYVSEDIYRFWKENGARILIYSALLVIAILGTQSWKYFSGAHEKSLREEFAQLSTSEEKEAFANDHKKHGLGGYAYMQLAKESLEAHEYEAALDCYANAEISLKDSEFIGIILLGKATALIELGRKAEAKSVLNKIVDNTEYADGMRAEAMFKLIVIADSDQQEEQVEALTQKLEAMDETGIWAERLKSVKYYQ